jgi:hypothetical protein
MVKPLVGPCRCCGGKVSSEAHTCPHCGQPEPFPHSWAAEARQYLAQGKKINAIKAVRGRDRNGRQGSEGFGGVVGTVNDHVATCLLTQSRTHAHVAKWGSSANPANRADGYRAIARSRRSSASVGRL